MSRTANKPHLLIVDDDDRLRALLKKFLREQGFLVTAASHADEARQALEWFVFDLMVLDVMMPKETGLSLLSSLRERRMPVLMLSAMGEPNDRIAGLEIGAEDYLVKPFEPKELVLRLRALLKRNVDMPARSGPLRFGEFSFDAQSAQLKRGSEVIALTSGEAALLRVLAGKAGQPISREELAAAMPGSASERSVDVQVTRLRKKIEDSAGKPVYLQTVRGAGYVLYVEAGGA